MFKKGDFAGAVKAYTESIKRDPNDPRGYNNRANAYTKLVALPEALKDAETAVKVDPKFGEYIAYLSSQMPTSINNRRLIVKAYIRKSHILYTMREYVKAIEAVQEAVEHDETNAHIKEIQEQIWKCQQAQFAQREGESENDVMDRALRDPEVAVCITPSSPLPLYPLTISLHSKL